MFMNITVSRKCYSSYSVYGVKKKKKQHLLKIYKLFLRVFDLFHNLEEHEDLMF